MEGRLKAERFTPPPAYEVWYQEVEECTGIEADFDRVRFLKVLAPLSEGGGAFPCDRFGTKMCPGLWRRPHKIFLAAGVLGAELVVKHEMWHEIRQSTEHRTIEDCITRRLPFGR